MTKKCSDGQIFDPERGDCIPRVVKESECSSDKLEPVPGDCSKYYRCVYGKKQEQKCWFFQRFDPETLSCNVVWNANCKYGTECESGDKAPSGKCNEYYQCEYGYWKRRVCESTIGIPTFFDSDSKNCLITDYNCSITECSIEGLKVEMPGDCSKYRVCRDGQFIAESCGRLQKFDIERKQCKYVGVSCTDQQDRPRCVDNERVSIDGSCYTFSECIGGQFENRFCLYPFFRFDKTTRTCRFMVDCNTQCYEAELKPVPGKCDRYSICHNGIYSTHTCPQNNYFDIVTYTCVEPKYATCA